MTVSQQTLGIVWGETRRLTPVDGSDDTKARLLAGFALFAARAENEAAAGAFAPAAALPSVASPSAPAAAKMATSVESALAFGQQAGLPLPKRAVLWETTKAGEPNEAQRTLPPAAAWIKDGTATRKSAFNLDGDAAHRIFTLFESDTEPKAGDPSFVSGLTGSGVPAAKRAQPPVTLPWALGILAAVIFFWMLTSLSWTGHSVKQARDLMAGTLPVLSAAYLEKLGSTCKAIGGTVCKDAFPTGDASADKDKAAAATTACVKPPASGVSPFRTSAFCQLAWSTALTSANSGQTSGVPGAGARVLAAVFGWPATVSQRTGALSLAFPLGGLIASIALLAVALGLGTKGNVFGIWVSPQNRISLARMQVTLWTIVVLGAYAAIALFNSGMLAESIQAAQQNGEQGSLLETLITFPTMPTAIALALGIAVASPMVSAIIKGDVGRQTANFAMDLADDSQDKDNSGVGRFIDRVKGSGANLDVRASPAQASLADLFLGETKNDRDNVDVSRLQNVLITFILVFGYATLLFDMAQGISPDAMVGALNDSKSLFPTLPNPGAVFTSLLAVSHGTYLVSKAASNH